MFWDKVNDQRAVIEAVVNPQYFAFRKELQLIADAMNSLQKEFLQEQLKTIKSLSNIAEDLSKRISKLETAAITPVTSRKVKRPKRKVSGNARKR